MNTADINDQLNNILNFQGTMACDQLPVHEVWKRPAYFVVNTDPSSGGGLHWVVIVLTDNGPNEYFDSFGFPPESPFIIQFLNNQTPYHF